MNRTTAKQKSSARPPLNLVDFCAHARDFTENEYLCTQNDKQYV